MIQEVKQPLVCQHVDGVASAPVNHRKTVDLLCHQHVHCIKQATERREGEEGGRGRRESREGEEGGRVGRERREGEEGGHESAYGQCQGTVLVGCMHTQEESTCNVWPSHFSIGSMLTRVDFNFVIFRSDTRWGQR